MSKIHLKTLIPSIATLLAMTSVSVAHAEVAIPEEYQKLYCSYGDRETGATSYRISTHLGKHSLIETNAGREYDRSEFYRIDEFTIEDGALNLRATRISRVFESKLQFELTITARVDSGSSAFPITGARVSTYTLPRDPGSQPFASTEIYCYLP